MIYAFGSYTLDADRLELRRAADTVAVEPQVFSLLLCLIENRNRVVSKDERDKLQRTLPDFSLAFVRRYHLISDPEDMAHLLDGLRMAGIPEER